MTGPVTSNSQANFYKLERNGNGAASLKADYLPIDSDGLNVKDAEYLKEEKLKSAAADFEAIFIRQFMKSMRTSMLSEGMYGDGSSGEIYADMMDNAVAEQLSKKGVLGISDVIYRQLIKEGDDSVTPAENSVKE